MVECRNWSRASDYWDIFTLARDRGAVAAVSSSLRQNRFTRKLIQVTGLAIVAIYYSRTGVSDQ
jgi:hypothetical protein